MSKKIVLHVFANLNLGGAESRIVDLFRNIDRNKVEFHFLKLTNDDNYYDDEIKNLGGKIYSISHPKRGLFKNLKEYFYFLKLNKKNISAIHFHVSYYSGYLVFLSKISGIKTLIVHSRNQNISNIDSVKIKLSSIIGRLLIIIFSTKLLAISKSSGDFLFKINSLIKRNYRIVPNAFELEKYFVENGLFKKEFNIKYKISENDIVIGNIGRLAVVKNQKFIIEILLEAKNSNIPIKLFIIGNGEHKVKNELMNKIEEYELESFVWFLGQKSNVSDYLQCFHLTILPSINEGLGVVALESQASGVPCLMSSGVPHEADIGLGICSFLSLDKNTKREWLLEIIRLSSLDKTSVKDRRTQFVNMGFTLENEISIMLNAYGISDD